MNADQTAGALLVAVGLLAVLVFAVVASAAIVMEKCKNRADRQKGKKR